MPGMSGERSGVDHSAEICGDGAMSVGDRFRYLWQNACRNLAASGRGPARRPYFPDIERARSAMSGQSPSRLITNLFLDSELPKLLPPRQIEILEIGCGAGDMAYRLAKLGYNGRYTGVDIQDRFRRDHPSDFAFEVDYRQIDAHEFAPKHPIDLMISVSTLEHIASDSRLISRFPGFFNPGGIELHVVPAGASLVPYLWHGFRQYTPAKLAARFGSNIDIIKIGGLGSFLLHAIVITGPEMLLGRSLRKVMPGIYLGLMRAALRIDRALPICPTAYAVIRRH
jgi:2-polyprenyl-3-methyl-5-hydroxy-6-metoxy-1,4-benzoquinol methylase